MRVVDSTDDVRPDEPAGWSPSTRAVTAGRGGQGASLNAPLWATTAWQSDGVDATRRLATRQRPDEFYGRYGNPSVRAFEQAIAELEGTDDALALASGMAALSTAVFALCSPGDHIVAQRAMFGGTVAFLAGPCARFGIEVSWVDGLDVADFAAAVRPGRTMLVIAESPNNPRAELLDVEAYGAISGPFTLLDSTLATPFAQRPAYHGVDLVWHSATKGICGHNDALLGVLAGEADLINTIWSYSVLHGANASPFDATNALRGLRTLPVRYRAQSATAVRLAAALRDHPGVAAVHHPSLADHPHHELAQRQLDAMPTVLAIDVGSVDAARVMVANLRLARSATSLGGPETLVSHSATSTHVALTPDEREAVGVTPGLLRVSVGLEDADDLVADFAQAIAAAAV